MEARITGQKYSQKQRFARTSKPHGMPCDVVEGIERERGLEKRRGDLGKREKMGLYGKKSATLCSNLRSPGCLAAWPAGRVCLQCD